MKFTPKNLLLYHSSGSLSPIASFLSNCCIRIIHYHGSTCGRTTKSGTLRAAGVFRKRLTDRKLFSPHCSRDFLLGKKIAIVCQNFAKHAKCAKRVKRAKNAKHAMICTTTTTTAAAATTTPPPTTTTTTTTSCSCSFLFLFLIMLLLFLLFLWLVLFCWCCSVGVVQLVLLLVLLLLLLQLQSLVSPLW